MRGPAPARKEPPLPSLPPGWMWAQLEELAADEPNAVTDGPFGSNLKTSHYTLEGPRVIRLQNIGEGVFRDERAHISEDHYRQLIKHSVEAGDLVIALLGNELPRACVVPMRVPPAIVKADCVRFRAHHEVDANYLNAILNAPPMRKRVKTIIHGVGRPRLSLRELKELVVPLPPAAEQRRIVAAMEEQFSRLDAGVQSLERARRNLIRFRTALVDAAVMGRLDLAHGPLQPSKNLIEEVNAHRRYRKKSGAPHFADNDAVLPRGWCWASLDDLVRDEPHALKAGPFGSALKKEFYTSAGYKIYGQEQVLRGDPYYGNYYIGADRYESLRSCSVTPGDLLVSLVGTIGRTLVLPDDIEPGIINPRLIKVSLDDRLMTPFFLRLALQSSPVRSYFAVEAHGGTMDVLNLTMLRRLPIPCPPRKLQDLILQEMQAQESTIDNLESELEMGLNRAKVLDKAILRDAFLGRLVAQDPTDESASKLLERMLAARTDHAGTLRGRSPRK